MTFMTKGVCCRQMEIDVQDGIINEVVFLGGCDGNLKAMAILVKGKKVEEVIELLEGVGCGRRGTSCAHQFTIALKEATGAA